MDTVTVVRARGRRLAKLIRADGSTEGYDNARAVDLHRVDAPDLDALAAILRDLASRWDRCIVRGDPLDPARASGVRRLCRPDPETGEPPTLREVARHWIALDLDGLPLPAETDPRDLAACAAAVVPLLPAAFHGARCIVHGRAKRR